MRRKRLRDGAGFRGDRATAFSTQSMSAVLRFIRLVLLSAFLIAFVDWIISSLARMSSDAPRDVWHDMGILLAAVLIAVWDLLRHRRPPRAVHYRRGLWTMRKALITGVVLLAGAIAFDLIVDRTGTFIWKRRTYFCPQCRSLKRESTSWFRSREEIKRTSGEEAFMAWYLREHPEHRHVWRFLSGKYSSVFLRVYADGGPSDMLFIHPSDHRRFLERVTPEQLATFNAHLLADPPRDANAAEMIEESLRGEGK